MGEIRQFLLAKRRCTSWLLVKKCQGLQRRSRAIPKQRNKVQVIPLIIPARRRAGSMKSVGFNNLKYSLNNNISDHPLFARTKDNDIASSLRISLMKVPLFEAGGH